MMHLFMGHVAHESRFDSFDCSLSIGRFHHIMGHKKDHSLVLEQGFDVSIDIFRALVTS